MLGVFAESEVPAMFEVRNLRRSQGFGLIEVLIGLAIVGFTLALGIPSLNEINRNSRIRAMADEYSDGLQIARQHAIQRNRSIRFDLNADGWQVVLPGATAGADTTLQSRARQLNEANYSISANMTSVTFSGTGRASTGSFQADIAFSGGTCKAVGGETRCLRIVVRPGGAIRTCDPAAGTTDARSCT